MEQRLDRVIDEAIAGNRIVGTVTLVAQNGATTYARAAGMADREAGRAMETDAIFRLASLTKPMVAATALALIDRGTFTLDQRATDWLPDFQPRLLDGFTPDITIQQLLTHTAGLGYASDDPGDPYRDANVSNGIDQPGLSMEEELRRIVSVPLYFEPGSAWRYSVAIDVLGAMIAKATNGSLGDAVAGLMTGPLSMPDTGFFITDKARLAAPYADAPGGPVLMADPHTITEGLGEGRVFSPSRAFRPDSFQSGGAGMVGTAGDFLRFLEAIRTGGAPILKTETVDTALQNHVGMFRDEEAPGEGFGYLSAIATDPDRANAPYTPGTARWGGLYGHSWFIDRTAGLSVVSLTNTAVEGCMGQFPDDIASAVYG
ncbi:serine hydrolase domain-containing protein [Bauldia sp.]|uniref:serine hydrolase domain-containing protein n=1 Tax=Bauldia sp. TaxID=2575872 RepID=UPI003BAB4328